MFVGFKIYVLSINSDIVHLRKYRIPFFTYNGFNLGFLWVHRKKIIVGFIEDKKSFQRTKDSVTTLEVNPLDDMPIDEIKRTIRELIKKYEH